MIPSTTTGYPPGGSSTPINLSLVDQTRDNQSSTAPTGQTRISANSVSTSSRPATAGHGSGPRPCAVRAAYSPMPVEEHERSFAVSHVRNHRRHHHHSRL